MKKIIQLVFLSLLFPKEAVAVLNFDATGVSADDAKILVQRLSTEMISVGKYRIVERAEVDKILKEQKFQNSGCTDSECAAQIGQFVNADFVVVGSINKLGSTYAVDARLINVELGEGVQSALFNHKGEIDVLLTSGITSIARQLCGMQKSKIETYS